MPRKPRQPRQARTARRPRPERKPTVNKRSKESEKPQGSLFFWKETESEGGFLAPWYQCEFVADSNTFSSAGHYITVEKAKLFGDKEAVKRLLATQDPEKQRAMGRKIKNFNEEVWKENCLVIAKSANAYKFSKERETLALRERLKATGERELVDASPYDRFWGIGMSVEEAKKATRKEWGDNLYGIAVMNARTNALFMDTPASLAVYDTPGSGLYVNF